jgi:hypothetical protein
VDLKRKEPTTQECQRWPISEWFTVEVIAYALELPEAAVVRQTANWGLLEWQKAHPEEFARARDLLLKERSKAAVTQKKGPGNKPTK